MKKEFFKLIDTFGGRYEISNLGRIRNAKSGKLMKSYTNNSGYPLVHLTYEKGLSKTYQVSRLVAKAFIPNPNNKPQVNHKDFNPLNNSASNLEWCTGEENRNHAVKNGRGSIYYKERRPVLMFDVFLDKRVGRFNSIYKASKVTGFTREEIVRSCSKKYIDADLYEVYVFRYEFGNKPTKPVIKAKTKTKKKPTSRNKK